MVIDGCLWNRPRVPSGNESFTELEGARGEEKMGVLTMDVVASGLHLMQI
jgi:hypothetical protein